MLAALGQLVAGCGGGGGGESSAATTSTLTYANSVALGSWTAQSIVYTAGVAPAPAEVTAGIASALLPKGAATLVGQHEESSLPSVLEVCVSGNGESTNVVAPINLGVVSQSAAVLLDAGWNPVPDSTAAWAAMAQRQAVLIGWENCGVKPEGAPSASSRLTVRPDGGYSEDVYDGNPGTTYNVISQTVSATQMSAMLGATGWATTADPTRPMQLYWRVFADGAARQLLIEMGVPRSTAQPSVKGFIALYVPSV